MNRNEFLKLLALMPFAGAYMKLNSLNILKSQLESTDKMPLLFVGHGSPTNAIENNEFTQGWHNSVANIPKPQAILCVSAHWETRGTWVTAMKQPRTIHDFGGFAPEMYEINYKAPGDEKLAEDIKEKVRKTDIGLDNQWGLDHGCWVPLMKMFPDADIPALQLSLDYTRDPQYHYDLAKELSFLRNKGVLIVSSGNMVHNLRMMSIKNFDEINKEFGFDWALEMNDIFKKKITEQDHKALINYESLSSSARLAIPSNEHYLPLLYTLGLQEKNENATFFNDKAVAGSLTMTSVLVN